MRLCEKGWAVAAFIPPAHTGLHLAAYESAPDAPTLPLFCYTAAGWLNDGFVVTALRIERDIRQEAAGFDTEAITSWVNRVAGDAPSDPPAVEPRSAPDTPAPPDQPPVDSRPTQLRDATDGASESDRGAADPISVFGAAQVKWLVPISALGLWAESPGDAAAGEPEGADPLRA